ncbi:MAG: hypothetical protein M9954_12125, partial [Cyclobacteriaceae bacterium]|nr:hypothetical protein [Cyclobacteriaceae bacterium]
MHFNWGDGTSETVVTLASGSTTYNVTRVHAFPSNSDCEYQVRIYMRVNGSFCANTQQTQIVSTWRTDAFNGGNVSLVSPVTNTAIHEVCEGQNISVVFNDVTNYNCNSVYPANYPPSDPIQTPNEQIRWQQIVYNTPIAGSKIPNISVNGVPVTGAGGADIIANYQDSRGVFLMTAPVVINDPRRRPTLLITAPGGFGPGFPVVGDEFEITLRYWNFCNPYDDPAVPGPPVDLINGDFPPVEQTALIRIIDSPTAPVVNPSGPFCENDGNGSFNFSATGSGTWTWYKDAALSIVLQGPNNDNTFNPVTQGPGAHRINKSVGASTVFHRYVTTTQGNGCESAPTDIVIRIDDTNTPGSISHPLGASPISVCSGDNPVAFNSVSPGSGGGPGGTIAYLWESSTTSGVAGFGPAAGVNTNPTYDPPALVAQTWFRRRVRSGNCNDVYSNVIEFRVDTPVTGGAIGNAQTICTGGNPGVITNATSPTGGNGSYTYLWQQSANMAGPYGPASGTNNGITYDPPVLASTMFYRRVVTSGVCAPGFALSNVIEITVDQLVV